MKNAKLRIGAVLLALVMCFGLLVGCGKKDGLTVKSVQKDPYAAVSSGSEKYIEAAGAKYESIGKVFDTISKGVGTYELKLSVPETMDIGLNTVVDSATGSFSGKLTAGMMGLSAEASLWGDKNNVALEIPALLGDGAYGVNFETFEADIKNSAVFEEMGTTYEEYKALLEEEMGMTFEELKEYLKAELYQNAYDQYLKDTEAIYKEMTATVTEENFKVGETEIPAVAVSYNVDQAIYNKMEETSNTLVKTLFGDLMDATGTEMDSFSEVASDLVIDEAMDEATESVETPEFTNLTIKSYLKKDTGVLIGMDFIIDDNFKGTVSYGTDPANTLDMVVDVTGTSDEGETLNGTFAIKDVTEEGKSGVIITVTAKTGEKTETMTFSAIRNDSDGKYEVKMTEGETDLFVLAGTLTYSDTEFFLSADSVTADGETTEIGLSFSAKAEGTVEAIPEYKDLAKMTTEDFQTLVMNVMTSDIMMMFSYQDDTGYGDYDEYYGEDYNVDGNEEIIYDDEYFYGDLSEDEIAALESSLAELETMEIELSDEELAALESALAEAETMDIGEMY